MKVTRIVRPIPLWQSVLLFLLPGLYGLFAQYTLTPTLTHFGISQENAYNITHLSVFILLILATIIALRIEGWPINWQTVRDRLRFERMDAKAWKWTLPFILFYLIAGLLLNMLAGFVYERFGFLPPDADVPLTNIPFFLIGYIINVFSEEMWWRGYILPRQELQHGKYAWLVNGVLWSLFHIGKWWGAVPFMLLKQWMIPLVAQRTKNNTPALLIHLISNGFGVLFSILSIL
jgi:membrane protease YdiL (CAAX protease family)